MDFCKTVDLLYAVLPLRRFRDWLIRTHMERCPRCQARLISRDEARSLLVVPGREGSSDELWQRIVREAGRAAAAPEVRMGAGSLAWKWASVTAMAAAVALTGFWLLREMGRPGFDANAIPTGDRFRIDYVKVGGEPAQTFIYQSRETDTVFIWASRNPL